MGTKIVGMEKLQAKLKKGVSMDKVKHVVRKNGSELQKKAMRNAEFKGHYEGKKFVKPTGKLKGSIMLDVTDVTAVVEPTAEYAPYVEFGTRYMDAQPYLGPAFNEQKEKFKRDMNKLVR